MMRRPASALAALSTLLLATCDLDKITATSTEGAGQTVNFTITGGNEVILGGTLDLDVSSPADITGTVEQWTSANASTATVNPTSGLVTGVAIGVTTISARLLSPELDTGVVKSQLVTVRYNGIRIAALDSIEGIGLSRPITANGLNASGAPVGSALNGVTWTSRDESIFEVIGTTVVAKKAGSHRLVAEFNGMKDSITVRVRPVAKRIVFPDTHYVADAINANRTVPIRVDDINDTPITTPTITWSVANPTVATVGATTGVIRFLKNDTTRVFATSDSVTRSIKVRVSQVPATITKTDGDAQSDTVLSTLATAPKVTVLDAGGTPVPGAEVTFAVGVGDGAVITDSVRITDANGEATIGSWTLGTNAGEQTLVVTSGDAVTTVTATATPGNATKLGFTAQPQSVAVGAEMAPVGVAVQDAYGNTVDTTGVLISLALDNNPGAASLGGDWEVETLNGVATFVDLVVNAGGTGYTLAATGPGLTAATSNPFTAFGGATHLGFVDHPTSSTAGVVMPPVRVAVLDADGNIVASSTASIGLTIATNPGGATLAGTTTVSAINGIATFTNLSLNSAGVGYRLQAAALSGPSLTTALSNTFTIAPIGSAAKLQFSVQPTNVVAGQPITPGIRVKVLDANGAVVTTGTHNITLAIGSNPGSATLTGTTTQATTAGEAIFGNISLTKVGTGYTLTATVSGTSITPTTSAAFDVTSSGATQLAFLNGPTHTVAGGTMSPVRVALLDVNGNVVTNAPTTAISLNVTGGACGSPMSGRGPVNTVAGIATFDALSAPSQMGPCFLQATATGFSNVSSTSFSIVSASTAVRLSFTAEPASSTTAGVGMNGGTVSFLNQAGTVVSPPSQTGVTISVLPGSASQFISNGQTSLATTTNATFNPITFNVAGTYRLVATATGYRPDTSAVFTVAPAAANRLGFVVPPTNTAAGVPFETPVQVAIRDQFNNLIPTATNTIRLQVFPNGGGSLARLNNGANFADVAAVNGVATFTGLAVYSAGSAWNVNVQAPGTSLFSASVPIDVQRAPLSTFGFTTQPAPSIQAGVTINGIQVQAQDSVGNAYTDFADDITISLVPDETLLGTKVATPASGVATFNGLSVQKAGTYRFSASGGGVGAGESDEFTITPAAANKLGFVRQPTNTFVNAPLSPADTVIVHVQDTFGNRVPTAHVVTFGIGNNPGGASLSGTLGIAAVNGEVRLGNDVTLNAVGNGYTITASTGGLTGATSNAFNVAQHGPADTLVFTVQPSNTVAGNAITPAVEVEIHDAWGNLVSTGPGSALQVLLTTTVDGTGEWFADASGGLATFANLVPTQTGTGLVLSANVVGTLDVDSPSDPFDVTPGAPFVLRFVPGSPTNIAPNVPIGFDIEVVDALGNRTPGAAGTVTISNYENLVTLGGTLTQPVVNGVASFTDISFPQEGVFHVFADGAGAGVDDVLGPDVTVSASGNICDVKTNHVLGTTTNGSLSTVDCGGPANPVDKFSVTTVAPATYFQATVASAAFSPAQFAPIWGPTAPSTGVESGVGPPSEAHLWYLVAPGTYEIRAGRNASFTFGGADAFDLTTVIDPGVPFNCQITFVTKNVSATQALSTACTDAHHPSGPLGGRVSSMRQYLIYQAAGMPITVRMNSADVDAYLEIALENGTLVGLSDNDGGGTNAAFTVPAPGVGQFLVIRAMHFVEAAGSPQNGSFTLTVDP